MIMLPDIEERAIMDLLAHFLGIAMHDNINAAPSGYTSRQVFEPEVEKASRRETVCLLVVDPPPDEESLDCQDDRRLT